MQWFESYLADRLFRAQIESKRSPPTSVRPFGVPQGSVLGSLLFVISQNDLPEATPNPASGQSVCYVDDDSEQESNKDPEQLQIALQTRTNNTTQWLMDNMMVVAPKKTKLIVSATRELRAARPIINPVRLKVGEVTVEPTQSEKLLGVVIDQDLTWRSHLWGETWREGKNWPGVFAQLLRRLGLLKHLAKISSRTKMVSFIPALFTSKVLYALPLPLIANIWGLQSYRVTEPNKFSTTQHDIRRLQSLQRQAGLLVRPPEPGAEPVPTEHLLQSLNWLSVHQLGAMTILTKAIMTVRTGKPAFIADRLTPANQTRTAKNQLVIPRCRLNLSLEGFTNQAARLYNALPDNIKREPDKRRLKANLKKWISHNIQPKV